MSRNVDSLYFHLIDVSINQGARVSVVASMSMSCPGRESPGGGFGGEEALFVLEGSI